MSNRKVYKIYEVNRHKFYQVPKQLFSSSYYRDLSSNAKLLYSILLDRLELSKKNNWVNDKGEVYLIFTRDEAKELLSISSKTTITKVFNELKDKKLIYEERQGLSKPNIIFIGKIDYKKGKNADISKKYRKCTSGSTENGLQEVQKVYSNYTYLNDTYKEEEEGGHSKNSENFSHQTAKMFFEVFERQIKDYEIKQLQSYQLPKEVIQKAIQLTGEYNGDTFAYLRHILEKWVNEGINTLEQFKQANSETTATKSRSYQELLESGYK